MRTNNNDRRFRVPSWLLAALFVFLGLAACNTMEGAGEDIEAGGEAIQDAAD